eukprot:jgi/Psemu1/182566/e_gw1.26.154.1
MDPDEILPLGRENSITPEGFGFSSPVFRVLNIADRNGGYYSAKASNIVTDVMDEITNGKADVALVFEDGEGGKLKGIFTETDYIEFSMERAKASKSEEEAAKYLFSPVKDYITSVDQVIALSKDDTANVAIASMKQANVRHLVIADQVENNRLTDKSEIIGVVNMQDVMSVVQKDERLSLQSIAKKYPYISSP